MDDRTVAIGALAIAAVSAVSGIMVGAAGGVFDSSNAYVAPPPLSSEGLQAAGAYSAEPATYQVFVPPTPTWQMADLTTPRAIPVTTEPAPTTTLPPAAAPLPPAPVATIVPRPTVNVAPVIQPPVARAPVTQPPVTQPAVTRAPVITTTEAPDARAAAGIPAQPAPTTTTTTRPVITIPPVTTRPQR
ncbi:hypothetical protein R4282_10365 [Rhodococcus oxybenzonivorans]|jgi:hypothetical protein|uniref:hypothetical protein n=1 Tax=Rhodococcus TaxID=1827 RepID=UPI0013575C24|nr:MULTISPECIES: hypothetical protein [Rhodococcus]MDV7353408.1 hypothetical protein [Rhodococcus oxybenzonivorans]